MKKVVLGLMLTAIAVGGSAFTNAKKAINEGYLIQPLSGIFLRASNANGGCFNLLSTLSCAYSVNAAGKINIPAQAWYSADDVNDFIAEGWLDEVPYSNHGLYIII
ncbi:hypothetical protein [Pedobacter sp. L105]|uniref:hypothetical protein n=1 Tax=Pedobacter sp. L105 TaxID=1641871 RepID=UPI00131D2998|nr:hypothetical protein [Pedobacter sp. L105]